MKSDQDRWYVYIRGWEYPCYELYVQKAEEEERHYEQERRKF